MPLTTGCLAPLPAQLLILAGHHLRLSLAHNGHRIPVNSLYSHPQNNLVMTPAIASRSRQPELPRVTQLPVDDGILLVPRERVDRRPHLHDARSPGRQHAVLQAVQVFAVDGWHKFARQEAQEHAGREVVLADACGHLEVLVKHSTEGKGDRLYHRHCKLFVTRTGATWRTTYLEVNDGCARQIRIRYDSMCLGIS